jgi:CRISPR-associated protein Csd2
MDRYQFCADPGRRHDFVLLFDVTDGNPNGDPDAGNMPRVDPETMHGLVTDVCLKRKVRDYVTLASKDPRNGIYVRHKGILANAQRDAYAALNLPPQDSPSEDARTKMCEQYYDVRMFGAVMTTGKAPTTNGKKNAKWNCGQVRGPMQLTFARSVDPITPLDLAITRVALTNADDTGKEDAGEDEAGSGQMGRKTLIPYGLYVARGFFSASLAGPPPAGTNVSRADLELFWTALEQMWDLDRSSSRGLMSCRGLYVFSHADKLGNAPAHELFERVQVSRRVEVEAPRHFSDYMVRVDGGGLPEGVDLTTLAPRPPKVSVAGEIAANGRAAEAVLAGR